MNEEQRSKYTEIVKNALSKAESAGYVFPYSKITIYKTDLLFGEYRGWLENIIFSHEWASAFFGGEMVKKGKWNVYPEYMPHLLELVKFPTIEERLEYIGKFL